MHLQYRLFRVRRSLCTAAILGVLLFAVSATATAQDRPKVAPPDSMQMMMNQMSGMMDLMYRQMAETMMTVTLEVLTKPETTDKLATFAKNYYDALIRKGFSKEQALQIVAGAGIPGPGAPPGR